MHHFVLPRDTWAKMNEQKKKGKKSQQTLDAVVVKEKLAKEFSCNSILHAATQFVVCNDQSLAVANKAVFRNCLVAMRPKTRTKELPSTHEVKTYIHNEFVKRLEALKACFEVS
ncbi:hypothetical protein JOM56_001314 [Amanita muscaria]